MGFNQGFPAAGHVQQVWQSHGAHGLHGAHGEVGASHEGFCRVLGFSLLIGLPKICLRTPETIPISMPSKAVAIVVVFASLYPSSG